MMAGTPEAAVPIDAQRSAAINVRHLRHVLLWPLRLMPTRGKRDAAGRHRTP